MRIALVDPLAYTPPYDHALASALAEQGHAVTLLTSRFPHGDAPAPAGYDREELFAPVSTRLFRRSPLRLAAKGLEYGPSVARLVRRIERLEPDVVHVQWLPRPELDLRWLRRIAAERPVVLTAHDVLPRRGPALSAWPDVLETAERVVVHSHRAVEQLVEVGLARERIARIPHPVFDGGPLPPPQGRTLLFFGLIRDYKGLPVLVRALKEIEDVRLVVAGDPVDPIEDTKDLARLIGVDDRVEWRLGFLSNGQVRDVMAAAAVVVLPYWSLDSSGVLATAIGYRRPVLVTDVGSLGEIVREFGAGEVVPPGDPWQLAEGVARLLEPDALSAAYEGAERAAKELTWERSAAEHDELYRAVRR
jgi:glycosyltransferase involved in cell wall biosynthesis